MLRPNPSPPLPPLLQHGNRRRQLAGEFSRAKDWAAAAKAAGDKARQKEAGQLIGLLKGGRRRAFMLVPGLEPALADVGRTICREPDTPHSHTTNLSHV